MIKVGIAGGAGYTAGELIRLLISHPQVEITSIISTSSAGKPVSDVHDDLLGSTDLMFDSSLNGDEDLIFLCLGHGNSKDFIEETTFPETVKIIDLSSDFRLAQDSNFNGRSFVYGLPEAKKEQVAAAENIANPGCFATAIQEALLPMADDKALIDEVHVNAITGSTGAGQSLSSTAHFAWRNNNVSIYKPFTHQHLAEIGETLADLANGHAPAINFIPVRGNFTRGIFASMYTKTEKSLDYWLKRYQEFFTEHPFVHLSDKPIHLKQVVNTNKCLLHLEKHGENLLVTSAIDNLLKGASGQAVQNMNIMFGINESTGLDLKPSQF